MKLQLFLRGIDVDDPEYELEGLKKKGKGRRMTRKEYYRSLVEKLKESGEWKTVVNDKLLRERAQEYRNTSKGSGSSLGSRTMDAGKFLAKEGSKAAAVKGALDRSI